MIKTFKYILIVTAGVLLAFWGFVTSIVVIGLIDRWSNPGLKSISSLDLGLYMEFSLFLIGIIAIISIVLLLNRFVFYKRKR